MDFALNEKMAPQKIKLSGKMVAVAKVTSLMDRKSFPQKTF